MAKLKLGPIEDEKSVKLTVELPAALHRDLIAYGEVLGRETGQIAVEPAKFCSSRKARALSANMTRRSLSGSPAPS